MRPALPRAGGGRSPAPTRLARWALRTASSPDRAAAILGDIAEDAAGRVPPPRLPALWIEWQTWRFAGAEARFGAGRLARAAGLALRDAVRSMRAAPRQTGFILFVLTLGMSAATVTFSVVDAVVLRPLPVSHQDRLVVVSGRTALTEGMGLSLQELVAFRNRADAFTAIGGAGRDVVEIGSGSERERVLAARTTVGLFAVLGVSAEIGRTFIVGEDRPERARVVLIGHTFWAERFGADPGAIGRTLLIDGKPHEIIGVMPPDFTYPIVAGAPFQLWLPHVMDRDRHAPEHTGYYRELQVVGRLRSGASIDQAQAQVDSITSALAQTYPDPFKEWRPQVTSLVDSTIGAIRGWMLLVLAAVGAVLVVVCFNVASLLLTRAAARARDQSIRASLGASGRHLAGALVIEGLLLAGAATGLALFVASWGVEATRSALPSGIVRAQSIALDLRVFAAAAAAALITGVLFGLAPAVSALRVDVASMLRLGARTITRGRSRWQTRLLVGEIAFVCVLLVATTLLVASFVQATTADLGFNRSRLVSTGQIREYPGTVSDFVRALAAVPGVETAAALMANPPLLSGFGISSRLQPPDPRTAPFSANFNYVSPEYFATAGIPILRGSTFGRNTDSLPGPIVIDELAASRLFGGGEAIGRVVQAPDFKRAFRVIGVVAHVRAAGPEAQVGPQMYMPIPPDAGSVYVLIRTVHDPYAVLPLIEARVKQLLPNPRPRPVVLEDQFRRLTATRRFTATVMSLFGLLAVVLGAAGIYGVMSVVVSDQTRDFGIRRALGATSAQIRASVFRRTSTYLAAGLGLGLACAWWVSRLFEAVLFEVSATDAWAYAVVASTLFAVGLGAAHLPARRAARVDPLVALRAD